MTSLSSQNEITDSKPSEAIKVKYFNLDIKSDCTCIVSGAIN